MLLSINKEGLIVFFIILTVHQLIYTSLDSSVVWTEFFGTTRIISVVSVYHFQSFLFDSILICF